ncbi:TIGR01777 family oxidoreductase [bacterium AH-315-C07]|nr:TIGR01777 family oxidoreductase [bacterium AH-315-C07]
MQNVLITGGTGLIGRHLSSLLEINQYKVSWLSRNPKPSSHYPSYKWNIKEDYIDPKAFSDCDIIIHLAGAGIADKRWSSKRKIEIYNSRINSTKLLFQFLTNNEHKVQHIICASAVGAYGNINDGTSKEEDSLSEDFLGKLCNDWEQEHHQFETLGIKTTIIRIAGMVLGNDGGGLPMMALPIKFGMGASIGSGSQPTSWVHVYDMCSIIKFLIENRLDGTFNCASPKLVTNKELTKAIAKTLKRPILLPNIPVFGLKVIFGELGKFMVYGSRPSVQKLTEAGFDFKYPELDQALEDLLIKN